MSIQWITDLELHWFLMADDRNPLSNGFLPVEKTKFLMQPSPNRNLFWGILQEIFHCTHLISFGESVKYFTPKSLDNARSNAKLKPTLSKYERTQIGFTVSVPESTIYKSSSKLL